MRKDQARELVKETFTRAFDRTRFLHFTRNLLNGFNEGKAQTMRVPDAFTKHVRSCYRLGTYESPDGEKADLLIVNTTDASKLERSRTALRDFVAHKLKRDESYKEAGLVAFVAPDDKSWRFSFVRMEYSNKRDPETGKIAVEEQLTPARRYSYLVGESESSHTAQSRFVELLQDSSNKPSLAKLEAAFSVETVTKEFFEQYKGLFLGLKEELDTQVKRDVTLRKDFETKRVDTADFAKKLLGQIVFLYFLQKKGWLGVPKGGDWGDGPTDFLRKLFRKEFRPYKNFYDEILEPLFYDTLAYDRGHKAWCETLNCRIPFLNGGLFEPLADYDWKKTHILLPNELFSNTTATSAGDSGSGILDVFDRYNFTVNEAEPLEKDVAIDPEMLGKVFENLLGVKERKSKGSFYTPREIVHYMCRESLIHYLDGTVNKKAEPLVPVKPGVNDLFRGPEAEQLALTANAPEVLVPREDIEAFIYSGEQAGHYEAAREAGTKSYSRQLPKSIGKHARLLDEKLADIAVCDPAIGSGAFPVGMMQEIVRARSALTPYFNDVEDRTPYHFKRHAIQHCLYGVDVDAGAVEIAKLRLWLSLVVDEVDVKQVKPLPNLDYKIVAGNTVLGLHGQQTNLFNAPILEQIEQLKPKFFNELNHDRKLNLKRKIDALLAECFRGAKQDLGYDVNFDFKVHFSEAFHFKQGFDVVIGNPPYVRQEEIKALKPALKAQKFEVYYGTADLLVYFYERGVKLLRPGGTLALITSNKYYRAKYGKELRSFLARELTLRTLIDFGDAPVFEAIAYASILIGDKARASENNAVTAYNWNAVDSVELVERIINEKSQTIRQGELTSDGWRLESPMTLRLLEKLRSKGTPLGEYVKGRFYRGILTGLNKAFVVDRKTRDRLIAEDTSSAELLKPFLRGRDVKRWLIQPQDLWLIFTRRGIDIKKYPAILKHLMQFKEQLMPGGAEGRKPGTYEWYEIQDNIAYWREFEEAKIVYPNICKRNEFVWDEEGFYANQKAFIITGASKYLLGVLNSEVVNYLYKTLLTRLQNGYYEPSSIYMETFPIPAASEAQQAAIAGLVNETLAAKKRDPAANVATWERKIDRLVYELYGLTEEEIRIVEGEVSV